jgi:hypothetical protein
MNSKLLVSYRTIQLITWDRFIDPHMRSHQIHTCHTFVLPSSPQFCLQTYRYLVPSGVAAATHDRHRWHMLGDFTVPTAMAHFTPPHYTVSTSRIYMYHLQLTTCPIGVRAPTFYTMPRAPCPSHTTRSHCVPFVLNLVPMAWLATPSQTATRAIPSAASTP